MSHPHAGVQPGAYVDEQVALAADAFVGPNAVILGADASGAGAQTAVEPGAWIGANATVYPGCRIGARARVMPGAVVRRSVPPLAIVEGNPAQIVGYVSTHAFAPAPTFRTEASANPGVQPTSVRGVTLHTLRTVPDLRGHLAVADIGKDVPFEIKRFFFVFSVPTEETRGEHAHKACKQFLVAVSGRINVVADDGASREEFVLDRPSVGLCLNEGVWGIQYRYSANAVLLALASHPYDPADYIRDYQEFVRYVSR